MDFFEAIQRRQSVRAFLDREVEDAALTPVLEAARIAPSAGNLQAVDILVVRDRDRKTALTEATFGQEFVAQAPVVLVFFRNTGRSSRRYGERGAQLYSTQDATISCAYAQLAATSLGLASCWVGAFDDRKVISSTRAPDGHLPAAILAIGHAAETPERTPRRSLDDLVCYDSF